MKNLYFLFFLLNICLKVQNGFCHSTSSEHTATTYCNSYSEKCEEEKNNIISSEFENNIGSIKKHDIINLEMKMKPWYLRVPLLPILFATSPTLPEGKCKKQVQKYLEELNNGTLWAVRSKFFYYNTEIIKY